MTLVIVTTKKQVIQSQSKCFEQQITSKFVYSDISMKLDIATDRPSDGCPVGTHGCGDVICPNTCFCEDHCSWKKCKLKNQPLGCIVHENRKWDYDHQANFWRIRLEGIVVNITDLFLICLYLINDVRQQNFY